MARESGGPAAGAPGPGQRASLADVARLAGVSHMTVSRVVNGTGPVRADTRRRVLDAVRRTGGAVADVSDEEVVEGIRLLARTEGVFAETAGGVTVATARKLIETGQLDSDAETVLLITGDGLKTLDAVSGRIGPTATVPASSKAVREALAALPH